MDRDRLDGALEDLTQRVAEWKTLRLDQFGKLILHGTYAIVIGSRDKERDVSGCDPFLVADTFFFCRIC
jgi:cell division control protein 24